MEYGENPQYRGRWAWLSYCFPIGSFSGVPIGLHWTWPLMFIYEVGRASRHGATWAWTIALTIVFLFLIVLCHEFSHVFAARSEHLPTERVMLWPLGGLAFIGGHAEGRAEAKIAIAGPGMNFAFAILLLPVLWIAGVVINPSLFNLFSWWPIEVRGEATFVPWLLAGVYKVNLLIMLFNLLPAYPMDGGRILCGLLHKKYGRVKSILVATTVGMVFGALFIGGGIFGQNFTLALIGVLVIWQSWQTRRAVRMQAMEQGAEQGFMGYDFSMGHTSLEQSFTTSNRPEERARKKEKAREEKETRRLEKEAEHEREIEREVDRLLDKIHEGGMDSLSRTERTFLEQASRRNQ